MAALTTVVPTQKRSPQRIGTRLEWTGTIAMAASYTTGGDVLQPKLLGMNAIDGGIIALHTNNYFLVIPQADGTAKIQAMVVTTAVEVANATNISSRTPFAIIHGR